MRLTKAGAMTAAAGVVALGGVAGTALAAGPVERDHLAGESGWVAHVDLEAAARTEIGRFLLDTIEEESDGYEEIREGLPGFTLSPEGGITGFTVFGPSLEDGDETFVALIYGDERIGGWGAQIDKLFAQHGVEDASMQIAGTKVWAVPTDNGGGESVFAGMLKRGDERLWVVSSRAELLGDAVSTIKAGNGGGAFGALTWREGTIAMAGVHDPSELADWDEMSHVVGQAKSIAARVGEADGRFFGQAWVETENQKAAEGMARVADGLLALGSMMQNEDPELARVMEFAKGLSVKAEGGRVMVSFDADADEIVSFLKETKGDHDHDGWHIDIDHDVHVESDDDGPGESGWEGDG